MERLQQLTAPKTAGIYKLRAGLAQEYGCNSAMGTSLGATEIGTIVVE